jgi:hypothetical protein
VAVLISLPFDVLFIIFLTPGGPSHYLPVKLAILAGCIVTGELFLLSAGSVRRVDVDSSGVTFWYILAKERGMWIDFRPGRFPPKEGMWHVVRTTKSGRQRGHTITLEQARAILAHPSRPRWDFAPGVAEALGMTNPG